MFFIMNKGKIISVAIALTMVLILFLLANSFRINVSNAANTSTNMIEDTRQTTNFNTLSNEN